MKPKQFESLVNSVRCKTALAQGSLRVVFESLVNSVRCKTHPPAPFPAPQFESLVNPVRHNKLKTITRKGDIHNGYLLLHTNEIMR